MISQFARVRFVSAVRMLLRIWTYFAINIYRLRDLKSDCFPHQLIQRRATDDKTWERVPPPHTHPLLYMH